MRPRGGGFAAPTIGLGGLVVLAVRTLVLTRSQAPAELQWRRHATSARVLVWGCLLLGLPGSMTFAWMTGAEAFCF